MLRKSGYREQESVHSLKFVVCSSIFFHDGRADIDRDSLSSNSTISDQDEESIRKSLNENCLKAEIRKKEKCSLSQDTLSEKI